MYFTKAFILFFSAVSVSALATPHEERGVDHRIIAGRIAVPIPQPATTTKKLDLTPPSPSDLPGFLVGTQTGSGMFYDVGLGACGITNSDTDFIAAVSHPLFAAFPGYDGVNPNNNPVCGRKITATYQGRSVTVAITDRCTWCTLTDLDFSPEAFIQLTGSLDDGFITGVQWVWD